VAGRRIIHKNEYAMLVDPQARRENPRESLREERAGHYSRRLHEPFVGTFSSARAAIRAKLNSLGSGRLAYCFQYLSGSGGRSHVRALRRAALREAAPSGRLHVLDMASNAGVRIVASED